MIINYVKTNHHVHNTKKMKVSVAAQIFSNNVAAVLKRMALSSSQPNGIPKKPEGTAEFLLSLDKVFDSVNGASLSIKSGKILICAVTNTSGHREFWAEAIKVFKNMNFLNSRKPPPTILNWVHTSKGFSYLWEKLSGGNLILMPKEFKSGPVRKHFWKN